MRAGVRLNGSVIATVLAGASLLMSIQTAIGAGCKPGHFRAPYFIKSMGACAFDPDTLSFAGTPAEQAMCLMRGMDVTRNLGPTLPSLPPALASRVGQSSGLPSREALSGYLSKQGSGMEFRRLSVAAAVARPRQRSGRADGALFRHPRHQRPEFTAIARFRTTSTAIRGSTICKALFARTNGAKPMS